MRWLHTADWHLGRTLYGHSRRREQEQFLDELVALAADVDAVLIAGDVYETANPPIEAEELLFDALARLGDGGRRAVVVIAGNHDSPDRLRAAAPLATRHGVWGGRAARRGAAGAARAGGGRVRGPRPGPARPRAAHRRAGWWVAALPYPSEARLRQVLSAGLDDRDRQAAYEERVAAVLAAQAERFRPDAVNVVVSHLAVRECMPGGSERALVGGAWQVSGRVFPARADYVALGHLHLAQEGPRRVPRAVLRGADAVPVLGARPPARGGARRGHRRPAGHDRARPAVVGAAAGAVGGRRRGRARARDRGRPARGARGSTSRSGRRRG
jgi:exonuclease SbcD